MKVPRKFSITLHATLLFFAIAACNAWAQQPNLDPSTPGNKPVPVVSFEMSFPGTKPAHYAVAVEATGRAAYRSDEIGQAGANEASTGQPYTEKFTVSDATRTRVFDLARQANYFKGNFDYTKTRLAKMGTKTLRYTEGPADSFGQYTTGARNEATYNWSENQAIQQLTTIFQGISNTMELGHRLAFLRRFDRLGMDDELKRAEEMAQDGRLVELQAIAPVLRDVSNDSNLMRLARDRAKRLLAKAGQ